MDKVEREIKKLHGAEGIRGHAAQCPPDANSTLLRHLEETEKLIRQRIESETLLIDELLELASVHCGTIQLRMARVDMHDVIVRAVRCCREELGDKRMDVVMTLEARWHHVRGDGGRLEQVMLNLLRNAIAFTPMTGRVRVATQDVGDVLEIVVTDNGVGIELDALPSVFGAFDNSVVDLDSVREGASLRVCKALVKIHGGDISAASQGLGTGTTFTVALPTVNGD
jgi:signal transduction histidine kinase